jgi:hypothetical protein
LALVAVIGTAKVPVSLGVPMIVPDGSSNKSPVGKAKPGKLVAEGLVAMPPTTTQQCVNRCATFASFRMANEQKTLFSKSSWPNRIFDEITVYLQHAVVHKARQRIPAFQRVINRLSGQPLRQSPSPNQLHGPVQPSQYGLRLPCSD